MLVVFNSSQCWNYFFVKTVEKQLTIINLIIERVGLRIFSWFQPNLVHAEKSPYGVWEFADDWRFWWMMKFCFQLAFRIWISSKRLILVPDLLLFVVFVVIKKTHLCSWDQYLKVIQCLLSWSKTVCLYQGAMISLTCMEASYTIRHTHTGWPSFPCKVNCSPMFWAFYIKTSIIIEITY